MTLDVLEEPRFRDAIAEALRKLPAALAEDAPEQRVVVCGLTWEQYEAIDRALGHARVGPRLYYLDGELEIMSTSLRHEEINGWLGSLVEDFFFESGVETFLHGQATMKKRMREAGAEPDRSWCFHTQKKFPDVVLEVALTGGGLPKREIYRRFRVPEVWFWRNDAIEIWILRANGSAYDGPERRSRILPELDFALLVRCMGKRTWREARKCSRQRIARK